MIFENLIGMTTRYMARKNLKQMIRKNNPSLSDIEINNIISKMYISKIQ